MSWDVTVQRFGKEYESVSEISDSESCVALGSSAEVRASIGRFFPEVDWTDMSWGLWESNYGSIEFNMGKDEPSTGFMMHIRASSEVVLTIVTMCRSEGWQALDCSDGVFLERVPNPDVGLQRWTDYRNQVVGDR